MTVVMKPHLYFSSVEIDKIKNMLETIEGFLIEMEMNGLDNSNTAFKHLVDAQDNLEMFLDNTEGWYDD